MDADETLLKIGDASFRWEDECPTKKRNRLAQREYRKRKRRCVYLRTEEPDSTTTSPSPRQTICETSDTGTDLSLAVQSAEPNGNLGLFPPRTDQVTSGERSEIDQVYSDTLNNASVYPCEGAPVCLPIASSPDIWHESYVEPGYFDFQTRGYLWRNEQGLPAPTTEACAGLPIFGGIQIGALSPSTSYSSPRPICNQPGFGSSRDDLTGERDRGMGHELMDRGAATSTNLEDRFEMILDTCEAAGFQSMDSMAAEYYTAFFPPESILAATQSRSRSRNLPELLDALYVASSPRASETEECWASNESEGFREQILKLASKILIDEVRHLEKTNEQRPNAAQPASEGRDDGVSSGGVSTPDVETAKRDRWRLEKTVPEIWFLLSELLGRPGSSQSHASPTVNAFVGTLAS